MKAHAAFHHPMDAQKHKWFLEFIRRVSPSADPTSVMLFGQVTRANNLLEQVAERKLGDAGLTWPKFRLLMNLGRGEQHGATEGMQPSELSDAQGVSRNTVSSLIASLEKDGLVTRELHGTDRRRFVIRLTPEGRKVLKAKLDDHFRFVTRCFDAFNASERQTLLEFLIRLNENLAAKSK